MKTGDVKSDYDWLCSIPLLFFNVPFLYRTILSYHLYHIFMNDAKEFSCQIIPGIM